MKSHIRSPCSFMSGLHVLSCQNCMQQFDKSMSCPISRSACCSYSPISGLRPVPRLQFYYSTRGFINGQRLKYLNIIYISAIMTPLQAILLHIRFKFILFKFRGEIYSKIEKRNCTASFNLQTFIQRHK